MSYNLIKIPDPVKIEPIYNPETNCLSFIYKNKNIELKIGKYPSVHFEIILDKYICYLYEIKILNRNNNIILFPNYIIFPCNVYSKKKNEKYYFHNTIDIHNMININDHFRNNKFIFQYKNKIVVGCDKKWIIN